MFINLKCPTVDAHLQHISFSLTKFTPC